MLERLGRGLSYANVMSTIAVFAVLGGGAYAAGTIGAGDIKKNAVRAKHVKKGQIAAKHLKRNAVTSAKLKAGAVTEGKLADGAVANRKLASGAVATRNLADGAVANRNIADGAVTGAKVDEGSLGTVPGADRLDGLDSLDLVQGPGRFHAARRSAAVSGAPSAPVNLDVGGTLTFTCNNPASVGSTLTFTNTSGATVDVWRDKIQGSALATTAVDYSSVPAGGTATSSISGPAVATGQALLRFTIASADRVSVTDTRIAFTGSECRITTVANEMRG